MTTQSRIKKSFYSQNGEDFLIDILFDNKNEGFFVEIGCIDGCRHSNTLHFEKKGWDGLCIEAHNDFIDLLTRNRPGSIVEHAAVGECDREDVEFYANSRGSLSSLDKNKEKDFKKFGKYFTGFETQHVPMLSLNTIFKKHNIDKIDFISLDIEGYEIQALNGLDIEKYRPIVFVIESDSSAHKKEIDQILLPIGYHHIATLGQNIFYSLRKEDKGKIGNKKFRNVLLIHTKHPVDNVDERKKMVSVSTKKSNLFARKVGRAIKSLIR